MTDAPRVAGSAGDKVIIGRSYYTWSPAGAREPDPLFATDAFVASFAGGQLAPLSQLRRPTVAATTSS